nr:MAG TPA: FeoB-associated Cys-rich membrane protein [Caudoviricetes sp.]
MDPVLMTLNIATMVILAVLIVLMHKWYKRR